MESIECLGCGELHPPEHYYRSKTGLIRRCRKCRNKQQSEFRQRDRLAALAHYGGQCRCCGEAEEAFLVIDHINDDGAAHRKEFRRALYISQWLRQNGYPDGFQVLCANCNTAKARPGGCPHQRRW